MAFDYVNYYRLEYLQTGGTQRIDTGIQGYCEFEIDFQLTSPGTSGYNSFFGSRQDGATNRFGCMNYNGTFHFMTGTGNTWNIAIDTNRHLIHFNSSIFTDNGTEYPVAVPGGSYGSRNFYLMWCNGVSGGSNGYWYYAKFWDSNGTLIREYYPARRKSDNVLGMYDAVNGTFTTNGGSGSFTGGNIVWFVDASVDPANSGTVSGTGDYIDGSSATITAVPNSGYNFNRWDLNGNTRYENPLEILVQDNVDLIAYFNKSANCRIKINGSWVDGKMYFKVNGQWVEGKPYVKVNGQWKEGI